MTHNPQSTFIEEVIEALSEHDFGRNRPSLSIILNAAAQVERKQALGAGRYELSKEQKWCTNGN